jgi:hypothetical protein
MPAGTKALPYITNVNPLNGTDNSLESSYNPTQIPEWNYDTSMIQPNTNGADGSFSAENYSFLVLNKNVVDIAGGSGGGQLDNFDVGAVYNEESGRTSKKVVGREALIKAGAGGFGTSRETSIIITGQMSGAIYVLPVKVNYVDNTPSE